MTKNKIDKNSDEQQFAVSSSLKKQDKLKSSADTLAVYLFHPYAAKRKVNPNIDQFFAKELEGVIANSQGHPVFFNIDNAVQYGKFISNHYIILKAYVPETAIVGKSQALFLKNNALSKKHVHGCYPGWGKGQVYYRNPSYYKLLDSPVSL